MIGAHPLLQVHRITKKLRFALLFTHHDGNSPLPDRRPFGYYCFKEIAVWTTRPLDVTPILPTFAPPQIRNLTLTPRPPDLDSATEAAQYKRKHYELR
jgi:hypothetical protein